MAEGESKIPQAPAGSKRKVAVAKSLAKISDLQATAGMVKRLEEEAAAAQKVATEFDAHVAKQIEHLQV